MAHISVIKLKIKISPAEAFYFLSKKNYFCFLDSSLENNKYSNFSYLCFEPDFAVKSFGKINEKEYFKENKISKHLCHPIEFINETMKEHFHFDFNNKKIKPSYSFYDEYEGFYEEDAAAFKKNFPHFKGGFIGYFSYDLKNYIEILPETVEDDLDLPIYNLLFFSKVFSYSHKEKCWYYMESSQSNNTPPSLSLIKSAAKKAKSILKKEAYNLSDNEIIKEIVQKYLKLKIKNIKVESDILKENYLASVLKAKNYIHEGDIYQVNFTHRFSGKMPIDAGDFYCILRKVNPAPFSAFLNFPEVKIASTSPERFILIKKDNIETRPIKGTRPRGENKSKDLLLKNELKESVKDRAELNMIVDLERNDLGKFCKYGSIKVKQHAVIEKYAKVFHSVSTVTGKIKNGVNFSDIIKAIFPGGSITGAPKIRAMQIIDELEKNARSIYTGSIGYIGIDGTVDLNIAIRTFIIKNENFYYNTGGGIVEDSVCEEEYLETLQKGEALKEALKFFEYKNLSKLKL
ncbi:MAG: aminodeoxychorismate synthase component I [Candidatus Humimicrobiaceae bacterium]